MNIRLPLVSDLAAITQVLNDTELFPPDMLEDMIAPFFSNADDSEKWLVCDVEGSGVVGFCYFRPEPLAEGTWNLLAIGFCQGHQGQGYWAAGDDKVIYTKALG